MNDTAGQPPRKRRYRAAGVVALCMLLALPMGCGGLPSLENRPFSTADLDTGATRLGRAIAPRAAAHPGLSGFYTLPQARDAFAARAVLAKAAERTLDVQYYIWRNDTTGSLLFASLREAADRGVRVRLLLDDNNTAGLDPTLAALDAHPNIEVRLFNPFVSRRVRVLGYLTDFGRANRRMHNKSFTADSQATVIGGRNVGDEYFGAADGVLFADLDVMAIGPVVTEVSKDFDRYWNSNSSYPADRILEKVGAATLDQLSDAVRQTERSAEAASYLAAVRGSTFVGKLVNGSLDLEWAGIRMVSDDPAKGLGQAPAGTLIFDKIKEAMGDPLSELNLVTPYFVPTNSGVADLAQLASRGVKVRVLTNALEATDVAAVHAGYARHRKTMLEAGMTLYELQRRAQVAPARKTISTGSSASSLHSKTFSVDRARVFIGSFNFDPRSANLNTEMGFVISSPPLAARVSAAFDQQVPEVAYEVRLSPQGKLIWIERHGDKVQEHDVEPGTTLSQRAGVAILSWLPIEWLL